MKMVFLQHNQGLLSPMRLSQLVSSAPDLVFLGSMCGDKTHRRKGGRQWPTKKGREKPELLSLLDQISFYPFLNIY
ncbi:hypothetical protein OIU74_011343, partial [Salix koriyanagi]